MTAVLTSPTVPTTGVALSVLLAAAATDYDTARRTYSGHRGMDCAGDAADLAEAAASLYTGNVELDRAARRVDELRAALRRLEQGTYGACERCARPINPARLEVLPAARTCVTC